MEILAKEPNPALRIGNQDKHLVCEFTDLMLIATKSKVNKTFKLKAMMIIIIRRYQKIIFKNFFFTFFKKKSFFV
jgi:hypothetical protein